MQHETLVAEVIRGQKRSTAVMIRVSLTVDKRTLARTGALTRHEDKELTKEKRAHRAC